MTIKIYKLPTGQDVIGEEASEGVLKYPLMLVPQQGRKPGEVVIGMLPYCDFVEDLEAPVQIRSWLSSYIPQTRMVAQFKDTVLQLKGQRANIILPGTRPPPEFRS